MSRHSGKFYCCLGWVQIGKRSRTRGWAVWHWPSVEKSALDINVNTRGDRAENREASPTFVHVCIRADSCLNQSAISCSFWPAPFHPSARLLLHSVRWWLAWPGLATARILIFGQCPAGFDERDGKWPQKMHSRTLQTFLANWRNGSTEISAVEHCTTRCTSPLQS